MRAGNRQARGLIRDDRAGRFGDRARSRDDPAESRADAAARLADAAAIVAAGATILEARCAHGGSRTFLLKPRPASADPSGMPRLRSHRRDRRARAPKRRKRRNLVKFIPEGDSDFALTASNFLSRLRSDPAGHDLAPEDVAEVEQAVTEYRSALAKSLLRHTRTKQTILLKDISREKCEQVIRRWANVIRANPDLDDVKKKILRLKPRPKKLKDRKCPQNPPELMFLGTGDGVAFEAGIGNGSGVHVLQWRANSSRYAGDRETGQWRRARPDGATRMELFVDLVPMGQPIPRHPAELTGRPWYLGSFTTSRMEVHFPIPSEPMLVVYWGRWADAKGRVGRFSRTCTARVEGWTQNARPALPQGSESPRIETKVVFVQVSRSEPAALPDYAGDDGLIDGRRAIEAMEVKRLPEAA